MKLIEVDANAKGNFTHLFHCPGCGSCHGVIAGRWTLSGTPEAPTITPSILVTGHLGGGNYGVCHSFVTAGTIQFLAVSTHALAGQTVVLPDWDSI